jgi:phosphate transport system protein
MSRHFEREIERLKKRVLSMTAVVERSVQKAAKALEERDPVLAQQVIDGDAAIDETEVEIEEECLKILALHQPVAANLRFLVAMLKINGELERVGDLAVNIAKRALFLSDRDPVDVPFDFSRMADRAMAMFSESLDALMDMDPVRADRVRASDDEVDDMKRDLQRRIIAAIPRNPDHVEALLNCLSVARHLERIGDVATNIAEDVIYMSQGDIVRHQPPVAAE